MLFVAPWMLFGLAALGVPIWLHLRERARTDAIDWPALRLLRIAQQQSAQRARLKHILVLLARCLLVALLVMAMAQPYTMDQTWARPPDLPTTLTVVLDSSYSMGYRIGGGETTRFERAKAIALQRLADLSLEDEVALILVNERAEVMTDRPTRDHDAVRQLIQDASLSMRATSLRDGLTSAFSLGRLDAPEPDADESDEAQKNSDQPKPPRKAWREVLLLTDMQVSGWQEMLDSDLIAKLEHTLPVTIVDVSAAEAASRFIKQVRMRSSTATGKLEVQIDVANLAGPSGGQASVWIDDRQVGSPELIPAATGSINLVVDLPAPGLHTGVVRIDEDRLPVDDRWLFAIDIAEGSRITVVDGDPSEVPALAETYYLKTALELSPGRSTALDVRNLRPSELSTTSLDDDGGVLLANVARLDGSALALLEDFLLAGGNIMVALGDRVDIEHYNRDWRFLPLRLDRTLGDPNRSRSYSIQIVADSHPIFIGQIDLSAARFFALVGCDPTTLVSGGRILATFSNGSPALIEGSYGREAGTTAGGRVLMMTSPLDDDWSNLPYRRAFVPLVDRLSSYLMRHRVAMRTIQIGRPLRLTGPGRLADRAVTIIAPDGTARSLNAVLDADTAQAVVDFRDTDQLGVYRMQAHEGFAGAGAVATNLDRRESMLMRAEPQTIRDAFGDGQVRIVEDQLAAMTAWQQTDEAQLAERRTEFWPALLVAALLIFAAETLLANFFTKRREAPPPPTTDYMGTRRSASATRIHQAES